MILFKNNASSRLQTGISDSDLSLTVYTGEGVLFPNPGTGEYFYCTIENSSGTLEIIKVTARSTDTFTIVRAQEGTSASAFSAGALVELRLTEQGLEDFIDAKVALPPTLITNAEFKVASRSTVATVGSDLVTNGGFDSSTTGWTATNSTLASVAGGQAGNCLEVTNVGTTGDARQTLTTVVGKLYRLQFYAKQGTCTSTVLTYVGTTDGGSQLQSYVFTPTGSWVQHTLYYVATSTTTYLRFGDAKDGTNGLTTLWDTITCYEVTPAFVAADGYCFDGWSKGFFGGGTTLPAVYADDAVVPPGYIRSLKLVTAAETSVSQVYNSVRTSAFWANRFLGRAFTWGAWVKCSTASAARLGIYCNGTSTYSSYHTGGGDWEWLEVTTTGPTTYTTRNAQFQLLLASSGSSITANYAGPMLIFGSSIGEGNFVPRGGEVISLDSVVTPTGFNGESHSSEGATYYNIIAWTAGKIGSGVSAVHMVLQANDSGSSGGAVNLYIISTGGAYFGLRLQGVANDAIRQSGPVVMELYATDTLGTALTATGTSTLDTTISFTAVRVR